MSDILGACRAHLAADAPTAALVSTRIYLQNLPQGTTLPAVVLELDGSELMDRRTAGTGTLWRSRVQVYAFAATYAALVALGEVLHTALEFLAGTWGTVTIEQSIVEMHHDEADYPRDGSDAVRHVRGMFVILWHR